MLKVLIKKTGEVVDIEDKWILRYVSFSLDFENVETIKLTETLTYSHGESYSKEGEYYLTTDGRKFH